MDEISCHLIFSQFIMNTKIIICNPFFDQRWTFRIKTCQISCPVIWKRIRKNSNILLTHNINMKFFIFYRKFSIYLIFNKFPNSWHFITEWEKYLLTNIFRRYAWICIVTKTNKQKSWSSKDGQAGRLSLFHTWWLAPLLC